MFPSAAPPAGSALSTAVMPLSNNAASATVRDIGPAVSWDTEIGMMPLRLTRPTVGLSPTRPLTEAGQIMLPSVSVPTPIAPRLAAIAVPVPELDPQGLRSSTYGFLVCPPRELHPDEDRVDRKLAHSLKLVLPRMTAPASRRRATMKPSAFGW